MAVFVEVAVNIPRVSGTFHYHLPMQLEGKVSAGSLVTIPFGNQRVQGIITRFIEQPEVHETRPLEELVDELPVVTPVQLKLAEWLARETLSSLSTCLDMMVPPGLSQHVDTLVSPTPELMSKTRVVHSQTETRLLRLLEERGALRGRQIETALPKQNWKAVVKSLEKKGVVTSISYLPPPTVRPKFIKTAQLAIPAEDIPNQLSRLGHQPKVIERRAAVLDFLASEPWPVDIAWVFATSRANLADLQKLEELGLILLSESEVWRDPLKEYHAPSSAIPDLSNDQVKVWQSIQVCLAHIYKGDLIKPILLNGVTGSGKTEIYLNAIHAIIQKGDQAIYLIPEISLTPQTIRRVLGRFPGRVGIIHSRMSAGERYDTWRRARAGLLSVVIGPRSALFTPFPSLKLIVVDECHEESYYQSDTLPYYHAARAAEAYGSLAGAVVILGSATPNVSQSYKAECGEWLELRLPNRIYNNSLTFQQLSNQPKSNGKLKTTAVEIKPPELPEIRLIDMREELKNGNRSIFSKDLLCELEHVLSVDQQAILFLNRRGTATYIFCRNCGQTIKCPRCDKPLTLHSLLGELLCHTCGYHRKQPKQCPQCSSNYIHALGIGTERVESEVHRLFPQAKTLRWDFDTTRQKGAHEVIMAHFSSHRADILIGTQMLAKGLDLPLVTLVGVILADISFYLPDYRSNERTFQILTQVSGRAGRSPLGGQVIMQSYQPDHYAIQAAAKHDQAGFYRKELEYRRQLNYPPFTRLMRLEYRHRENQKAESAASMMADQVATWIEKADRRSTDLIGPAPCFFGRNNGLFRWQIVVRGPDPAGFFNDRPLPADWKVELDPQNLL
jgi:primosomal protein N' (replication factor Y)